MYKEVSKLLLYSDLGKNSVLGNLCAVFREVDDGAIDNSTAVQKIYTEIKRLLDIATAYGFNENLWQNYLTFLLITNENSFSMTCERVGAAIGGSVNKFALADFEVFRKLFHYDFSEIESKLGVDCFSVITDYKAIPKRDCLYNKSVSEKVTELSRLIAKAENAQAVFDIITEHYRKFGVGMFGLNRAFRIRGEGED